MCGRFTLRTDFRDLVQEMGLEDISELTPRYNIAPTQEVAAVRWNPHTAEQELALLRWGLIPFWAKDVKIGNRMINARSETIAEKPSFRNAFTKRRCLILADGFYEWQKLAGGKKQAHYIHRKDDKPFAMAGLWEFWKDEKQAIESCTIITTTANRVMEPLHERMPVILSPNDFADWLDGENRDKAALQELLKPCAEELLETYPVTPLVNSPRNEDPACINRLSLNKVFDFDG